MKKMTRSTDIAKLLMLIAFISFSIISCKKKEEIPALSTINEYFPLKVGKYIVYRLDSTVATEDAKRLVVHTYMIKDSVDEQFVDNQGRVSFRISRFIRDSAGLGAWRGNTTLFATLTPNNLGTGGSIEFVENNLRFIKLKEPVREGFVWPGNSYINTNNDFYRYYDGWEYTYEDVGGSLTVGTKNFSSALTVVQQPNEGGTEDLSNPSVKFDERNYSVEKYAKGVGLVYKEFIHWTFHRDELNSNIYYFTENSYGVKLTVLDYN
ncbi:MAG TPA: hypothetical protein VFN30_05045 [Chitinophagaceae bacterium]|nr:hypothetical protein [Chitinophagaceae bacterium]